MLANSRSLLFLLVLLASHVFAASVSAQEPGNTTSDWGPLELSSATIEPGSKQKFTFEPTRSFESAFLDTPLWAAQGTTDGPTLCVVAGIHGDEINSFEIARRAFKAIDPQQLKGTVIVVPAANSLGFRTMNRYMIDRRDLNRAFPGSAKGSVTSLVANAIFERVVRRCDYLIDLHTGSNFRTNMPQIRVDMGDAKALELAESFGIGVIVDGAGPSGSLRREAVKAGVAAIIYESGPPFVFVEREIANGTQGVLNVMNHLGMYATPGEKAKVQKLVRSGWVRVPRGQGGIFLTAVKLGDRVEVGDLLGTVTDPVTDIGHEIRADRAGIVIGAALPAVVLSGYGIFHIGAGQNAAEDWEQLNQAPH
ncbi:MAG: succinylglutamate desuccinylase/aspartoacylase family protein [Haliea sp.]|nr:succinylglutamate desuccinylase/aspartoacylase family protein [Haliea sp.]